MDALYFMEILRFYSLIVLPKTVRYRMFLNAILGSKYVWDWTPIMFPWKRHLLHLQNTLATSIIEMILLTD